MQQSPVSALLDAFLSRGRTSSFSVYRALVRIMGHDDEGCLPYEVPENDRLSLRSKILTFRKTEIIELLHFVEDSGYERCCAGYGLFAIIPQISEHAFILKEICESLQLSEEIRENAALLLAIKENDLHWWELWLPSNM